MFGVGDIIEICLRAANRRRVVAVIPCPVGGKRALRTGIAPAFAPRGCGNYNGGTGSTVITLDRLVIYGRYRNDIDGILPATVIYIFPLPKTITCSEEYNLPLLGNGIF